MKKDSWGGKKRLDRGVEEIRLESMMNARKLLSEVRANYKACKRFYGYASYGNVVVSGHPLKNGRWFYEVGTYACLHDSGKSSEIIPVLDALLQTAELDLEKKKLV